MNEHSSQNKRGTIYAEVSGCIRLGNWMFIYAAAASTGATVRFSNILEPVDQKLFNIYKDLFKLPPPVRDIPADVTRYREPAFTYSPLPEVPPAGLHIFGDFQSEKYFDEARVRSDFSISPEREKRLRVKYEDWLNRKNVTAIHVRRGDYMRWPQFYPFVGKKYFHDCLARLPECSDFIVCSDDLRWCKRFFPKAFPEKNFCFAEGNSPLDDLFLMSLCKNNIISNSTFSWWSGWLNSNPAKRVFAPGMWFGFGRQLDWKDIYFKGTEVVPNDYTLALRLSAYWYTAREAFGQFVWKVLRFLHLKSR